MFRLLWAQAVDECHTAIVVEVYGELLGGVAVLRSIDCNHSIGSQPYSCQMDLSFIWVWFEVVDSAEAFRNSRKWERKLLEASPDQKQLDAPQKQLPAPHRQLTG